jgi:inosine-uridine nucleoside N-ribohydrolase
VLELAGRTDDPGRAGADRPLVPRARSPPRSTARPARRARAPAAERGAGAEHAVDLIARARAERRTLVATGPLTNVALLLALHPDARGRSGSC